MLIGTPGLSGVKKRRSSNRTCLNKNKTKNIIKCIFYEKRWSKAPSFPVWTEDEGNTIRINLMLLFQVRYCVVPRPLRSVLYAFLWSNIVVVTLSPPCAFKGLPNQVQRCVFGSVPSCMSFSLCGSAQSSSCFYGHNSPQTWESM